MSKANDLRWKVEAQSIPSLGIRSMHAVNITHTHPLHAHADYCIVAILSGREQFLNANSDVVATAGDLLLINAGQPHESRSLNAEYLVVYIPPLLLFEMVGDRIFHGEIVRDRRHFKSFVDFYRLLSSAHAQSRSLSVNLVNIVRALTSRRTAKPVHPVSRLSRAISTVKQAVGHDLSRNWSLAEMSALTRMDRYQFLRHFKNSTGITPHEYLIQLRVDLAKRLLSQGRPISDVAIEAGFFDQSHLSRHFARIFGATPGTFQRHSKSLPH